MFPNKISANNDLIQEENIYVEIEIGEPAYSEKISLYSMTKTVLNYKIITIEMLKVKSYGQ